MRNERGARIGRKEGFTLVELLVVIAIIGLLASIVGVNVMSRMRKARQTKAKMDIRNIETACTMFRIDNARYPNSIDDLFAPPADLRNWDGPYLKENALPIDPWGTPYQYYSDGNDLTIMSFGADGVEGGEDEARDISNHEDDTMGQPR